MYTYDAITKSGLLIHLTMFNNTVGYILVIDEFTLDFKMKYFTDMESAKKFIHTL